ncbi:MAG: UDP-N-acetylmuramate dehydrogenase [Eubacterium sp.]|jgi:UDP-N-acetylmuramate dehydrogenase|nr:UDP-N-acetylmuramate dehydrogenase [Eubacterium sp.]MEE3398188.1 UDP-N-acetylmuramate dehydrogenase [Eubacterium sp.]
MSDYKLLENVCMADYCTFKAGGNAKQLYLVSNVQGLKEVLSIIRSLNQKPYILGNGSNILVSDKGIEDPVVMLCDDFNIITVEDDVITAGAAALLSKVSRVAYENGLGGAEFASGIPGTVGGAIFMNAGAYGGEMKDIVTSVDLLKNGEEITVSSGDMNFSYRHSIAMDEDMIVLRMRIKLVRKDKSEILSLMDDLNGRRRDKQPLEYPSAGSTFKRPEGYFAGKLIMDSGLSGERVGGAMVSTKHCGFIINYDNATATEIYELIKKVQSIVYEKQGVMLEPEVRLIGDFE